MQNSTIYVQTDFGAMEVKFLPPKVRIDYELLREIDATSDPDVTFNHLEFAPQCNAPAISVILLLFYKVEAQKRTHRVKMTGFSGSEFMKLTTEIINFQQANMVSFTAEQVKEAHYEVAFELPF